MHLRSPFENEFAETCYWHVGQATRASNLCIVIYAAVESIQVIHNPVTWTGVKCFLEPVGASGWAMKTGLTQVLGPNQKFSHSRIPTTPVTSTVGSIGLLSGS